MSEQELFTLAVAIAVVVILGRGLANRLEIPEAIVLVVLGVLASLIPQVPNITLSPDIVLLVFVPPLIYNAAFLSAPRETRENAVPITALAIGATGVTIIGVGWVSRLVLPGLGWAPALAFAAAVAPTDAVAATSVLSRLGAPHRRGDDPGRREPDQRRGRADRVRAGRRGDGAPVHLSATVWCGSSRSSSAGSPTGSSSALVIGRVRRWVRDPSLQILVSLITPFVAYIPAEQFHVSGVLAAATTGVYLGTRTEGLLQPASRVSGTMFWRTLIFLLESALFVLLGLELRSVVDHLSTTISVARLAGASAALVAAVIGIRLAWELIVSPLLRLLPGRHSSYVQNPWRQRLIIGWGGMRGAITLAIALSLPELLHGEPFTQRSTLIFLAAVIVVATLIGEGLTLAPLLRALGMAQSDLHRRAEARARARVTEAGLARLDQLAEDGEVDEDTANLYRQLFEMRLDRVRAVLDDTGDGASDGAAADGAASHRDLRAELLRAERDKLAELYAKGKITDDVRRSISRTLDLQEPRPFQ